MIVTSKYTKGANMYRVEIFDQGLQPVDFAVISDAVEIVEDYVTLSNYEIEIPKIINVQFGAVARIMDENGKEITLAYVRAVDHTKYTTRLTCTSILGLLDFDTFQPRLIGNDVATNEIMWGGNTFLTRNQDTGSWLATACAAQFKYYTDNAAAVYSINGYDATLTASPSITPRDGVANNIYSLFTDEKAPRSLFDVYTLSRVYEGRTIRAAFDFSGAVTRLNLYLKRSTTAAVIETDLKNVIDKDINISNEQGANRLYFMRGYSEGMYTSEIYYKHPDGTVDTNATDTITPVIIAYGKYEYDNNKSAAENLTAAQELAVSLLTQSQDDNSITVSVRRDDALIDFDTMRQITDAVIISNGVAYSSTFTGFKLKGAVVTYMFGNVRNDLTSKLAIERRKNK